MKPNKKLILVILGILISMTLFGCSKETTRNPDKDFKDFCNSLTESMLSEDSLSLHFSIKNPEKLGFKEPKPSFGHVLTKNLKDKKGFYNKMLLSLSEISKAELSPEDSYYYDTIYNFLSNEAELLSYEYKYEPLQAFSGTHVQTPLLLSEYCFYDLEDVKNYHRLMKTFPDYIKEILQYEYEKSRAGEFMSESNLNNVVDFCNKISQSVVDNHFLHTTFLSRLENLKLSEEEKNCYIEENKQIISTYIFPAYKLLSDGMKSISEESTKNNAGLCSLPDGSDYFSLLLKERTGCSLPSNEIQILLEKNLNLLTASVNNNLKNDPGLWEIILSNNISEKLPAEDMEDTAMSYLNILKKNTEDKQNTNIKNKFRLKQIEPALSEYFSCAFFLVPPIDDTKNPCIYLNPDTTFTAFDLFTTLAHEGFPGHLYQTVLQKESILTRLFSCLGYCEGWATYSELASYPEAVELLGLNGDRKVSETAALLKTYRELTLNIYALLDYNINMNHWTIDDATEYLKAYGITEEENIHKIYEYIVSEPATYLTYYVGYLNVLGLKKDFVSAGNNPEEFEQEFLSCPEAPFEVVRTKLLQK